MSDRVRFDGFSAAARRARRALGGIRRAPRRLGERCRIAGHELVVPRGVPHPLADGGTSFYYRIVGPMIAPGKRVLVVGCGAGLGAVVAGSRGASVVAVDPNPAAVAATAANVQAAGLTAVVELRTGRAEDVVQDGPFDLVLLDRGRWTSSSVPGWLGERGRLVRLISPPGPGEPLPEGYRAVRLACSPGLFAPFEAVSIGWDLERARTARHEARRSDDAERRAAVSRRRWEGVDPERPGGRSSEASAPDGAPRG